MLPSLRARKMRATSDKENAAGTSAASTFAAASSSGSAPKPRIGGVGRPRTRAAASKHHGPTTKTRLWRKPSVMRAKAKAHAVKRRSEKKDSMQFDPPGSQYCAVEGRGGDGGLREGTCIDVPNESSRSSLHRPDSATSCPMASAFASIPSGILPHPESSPRSRRCDTSCHRSNSTRPSSSPQPRNQIHLIANYPFYGLPISPAEHASYVNQPGKPHPDAETVQLPSDAYEIPESLYAGHHQNEHQAQRYRQYVDAWRSGKYGLQHPPISVPVLEKFTSLFPAIPARALDGGDGTVVYPFHVISTKLVVPVIPPVTHTMENGTRLPVDYVLIRMIDHLPLVWQMKELYTQAPPSMQKPPTRINTPAYELGTRIDDTHDEIVFWNREANEHGGLNEEGKRLVEVRGPNVALVVREIGDSESPGMVIPVLKTVMSLQCSHFARLVSQGQALRNRGDLNAQYSVDETARRKKAADILSHRARSLCSRAPVTSAAIQVTRDRSSVSSSPNACSAYPHDGRAVGIPAEPIQGHSELASTATIHPSFTLPSRPTLDDPPLRRSFDSALNAPHGGDEQHTRERIDVRRAPPGANGLYVIPTPAITIRHPGTSSPRTSRQHRHTTARRPASAQEDDDEATETDAGRARSEADTEAVYSVHTTSDIGSVSAITSQSGTSLSGATTSSRSDSFSSPEMPPRPASAGQSDDNNEACDSGSDTEVPSEGSFHTATPHTRARGEDAPTIDDDEPRIERTRVPRSVSAAFSPRSVSTSTIRAEYAPAVMQQEQNRSARRHPLYVSPTRLVGQTRIVPGNMRATYGIKTLPILSLYIPDLKSFPDLLRHLHHPREPLVPALAGFDPATEPINSTAQLQVRLYALSAYELLFRVESFRRFVANLAALGIGARSTWQQVEMVHQAFMRVLTCRGGIHNAAMERIAIPLIEGESLPEVVFSKYDEEMLESHHRWAALRRVKAEEYGLVPVIDPKAHSYGL